jgi:hypothetical protein
VQATTLVREMASANLTGAQLNRIAQLAQAQLHRQRMFSSCGWFFEQLDRPEPRYVVAQALRAIQLVKQAAEIDLGPNFREALCAARCTPAPHPSGDRTIYTAADLYDEWVERRSDARPA